MTRKDFQEIADIVQCCTINEGRHIDKCQFVDTMADYFSTKNLRFDREKFLTACGFSS